MPKSSAPILSTALIVALAPNAGCAVFNKLLGKEEAQPEPPPASPGPPKTARPVPPYTEAQWTEFTAAATAKIKDDSATLQTLRFVGTYPSSAPQELMVKADHCYYVSPEWVQTEYPTLVHVKYGKDADGKSIHDRLSNAHKVLSTTDVMLFCADADGSVTLTTTLLLRDGGTPPLSRPDEVQWAVVVGEHPESESQRKARRAQEWDDINTQYMNDERISYGREVARVCQSCRGRFVFCLDEQKGAGEEAAREKCMSRFEICAAAAGQDSSLRSNCHSPL